jgi:hypothetical protein
MVLKAIKYDKNIAIKEQLYSHFYERDETVVCKYQ